MLTRMDTPEVKAQAAEAKKAGKKTKKKLAICVVAFTLMTLLSSYMLTESFHGSYYKTGYFLWIVFNLVRIVSVAQIVGTLKPKKAEGKARRSESLMKTFINESPKSVYEFLMVHGNKCKWDSTVRSIQKKEIGGPPQKEGLQVLEEKFSVAYQDSFLGDPAHASDPEKGSRQLSGTLTRFCFPWVKNSFVCIEETKLQASPEDSESCLKMTEVYMILQPVNYSQKTIIFCYLKMNSSKFSQTQLHDVKMAKMHDLSIMACNLRECKHQNFLQMFAEEHDMDEDISVIGDEKVGTAYMDLLMKNQWRKAGYYVGEPTESSEESVIEDDQALP